MVMAAEELYAQVCQAYPWLIDVIEAWLAEQSEGRVIHQRHLKSLSYGRVATDQQIVSCVSAYRAMGILVGPRFSLAKFLSTVGLRQGVRFGVSACTRSQPQMPDVDICLALPVELDSQTRSRLMGATHDLRAAMRDLVLSAQHRLVIGIPFWDPETAAEWAALIKRRVDAGVQVDLLTRGFTPKQKKASSILSDILGGTPNCRIWAWSRWSVMNPLGTQTFHFKVIVADDGQKAYLGSANMTKASLQSQMELGIIFRDSTSKELARVMDEVLRVATPLTRG